MNQEHSHYHAVAIVLHWAIAAGILLNLALGLWMHEAIDEAGRQATAIAAFQLHKSIGLSVLALSLLRLLWRLVSPQPPALPMPAWQRLAASLTHWVFYFLMLALPLSGWLYVSTQWRHGAALSVPTLWFGLFEVPHLFGLNEASQSIRAAWAERALLTHLALAWSFIGLLALHVGAALKHQFVNRDGGLLRMLPLPGSSAWANCSVMQRITLLAGAGAIIASVGAILMALLLPGWFPGAQPGIQTNSGIRSPAGDWAIQADDSHIRFAGTHAGAEFDGRFVRWEANLNLDENQPLDTRVSATVETASATDGLPLHDSTLKEKEWFNVAQYPQARFDSSKVSELGPGSYEIVGSLKIKDQRIEPLRLRLELGEDKAVITGDVEIDRAAANMGMESDPSGQWVSKTIDVSVRASFIRR